MASQKIINRIGRLLSNDDGRLIVPWLNNEIEVRALAAIVPATEGDIFFHGPCKIRTVCLQHQLSQPYWRKNRAIFVYLQILEFHNLVHQFPLERMRSIDEYRFGVNAIINIAGGSDNEFESASFKLGLVTQDRDLKHIPHHVVAQLLGHSFQDSSLVYMLALGGYDVILSTMKSQIGRESIIRVSLRIFARIFTFHIEFALGISASNLLAVLDSIILAYPLNCEMLFLILEVLVAISSVRAISDLIASTRMLDGYLQLIMMRQQTTAITTGILRVLRMQIPSEESTPVWISSMASFLTDIPLTYKSESGFELLCTMQKWATLSLSANVLIAQSCMMQIIVQVLPTKTRGICMNSKAQTMGIALLITLAQAHDDHKKLIVRFGGLQSSVYFLKNLGFTHDGVDIQSVCELLYELVHDNTVNTREMRDLGGLSACRRAKQLLSNHSGDMMAVASMDKLETLLGMMESFD